MSNSSYQKLNSDDDLLVTCFSNDAHSKRLSTEDSIRVFWETKFPMRLDFSREDWEVALVNFSCRNRERLDVELLVTRSDDDKFQQVLPLPTGIYDSTLELVSEAYGLLNSEKVLPSPPFVDLSEEELHCLWHDNESGVFRVRHYIARNENFATFMDSDKTKFESSYEFLNYLRDVLCVKLDAGHHNTSDFSQTLQTTFLGQHDFAPNGSERLETIGIASNSFGFNNSKRPNWVTAVTLVFTKKLAVLCHFLDQNSFSNVYNAYNPFGYSLQVNFSYFSGNNKEFIAVNFATKNEFQISTTLFDFRNNMPPEILSPIPMLSCTADSKNDKIIFKKGHNKMFFSLAYNPPSHNHVESLVFEDGPISDLSRFAPSPIPSEALPSCRFVKVGVTGLNLKDDWTMKGWQDESDVVVFSVKLPREKKTLSFSPFIHKENYVPIQTHGCNALRISVEFDDSFLPQTNRPKFYVGATSVALKFREKWKAGADFTRDVQV